MAVVAITAQNTRLSDAETATGYLGLGGAQVGVEPDFFYQNANCIAPTKGKSGEHGFSYDHGSTNDMTGAGTYQHVIFKVMSYAPGLLVTKANGGLRVRIGSDLNNYYLYTVHGGDTYPATSSWLIVPVSPNVAAYRDSTTGTPVITAVDYFANTINATAAAKIGALGWDAIDIGAGLTLVGGDGADADGTLQDFIDHDEGTINNRYGYIRTLEGIAYAVGTLIIGSATATVFTDANRTLVYTDGLFDEGFSGTSLSLASVSTVINIDSFTIAGAGSGSTIQDFHTTNDVDGTNEEVDIVGHGYKTGDYVTYSKQGGTASMGLTDATSYWVNAVTDDAIAFYTTYLNSLSDTSRVNLTASGTETHRLTKVQDQRPDFVVSGTSGSAVLDGNTYLNHRNVTFTSAASQDGGRIECELLTQGSADIENVTIVTSAAPSIACLQDPTFGTTTGLHDVNFVQSSLGICGHAIELDTATSYTFTNLFFSGYGATTSDQAALDVTAASGTVTVTINGGDTPTYKTAGATVVFVVGAVTVKVTATTADGTPVQSANVLLKASDGTGPFPFEESVTITRSVSTATVTHTAHGLATNDKVAIEGAVEDEYNKVATITVTGANTYTYTVSGTPATPATGTITSTFVALQGNTDVNGEISASRTYATNQPVTGWARKSTASPFLAEGVINGVINSSTGFDQGAVMTSDE